MGLAQGFQGVAAWPHCCRACGEEPVAEEARSPYGTQEAKRERSGPGSHCPLQVPSPPVTPLPSTRPHLLRFLPPPSSRGPRLHHWSLGDGPDPSRSSGFVSVLTWTWQCLLQSLCCLCTSEFLSAHGFPLEGHPFTVWGVWCVWLRVLGLELKVPDSCPYP